MLVPLSDTGAEWYHQQATAVLLNNWPKFTSSESQSVICCPDCCWLPLAPSSMRYWLSPEDDLMLHLSPVQQECTQGGAKGAMVGCHAGAAVLSAAAMAGTSLGAKEPNLVLWKV